MTVPAQLVPRQWNIYRSVPRERVAESIRIFIAALDFSKAYRVRIEVAKSSRSDKQNNYLNGVAYKIFGDELGWERDEVSEHMCGEYWGWKDKPVPKSPRNPDGFKSVPIRTTTRDENGQRDVLGKMKFAEYVAFVQRYAAEQGIHIPDPDPDYTEHRDEQVA